MAKKVGLFDDYVKEEANDFLIDEYDLTASPNDFNVATIYNFIESGAVRIPDFQRSFVWDLKRSSKLIESLIIGLPVPQVFLYEEARNRYSVIDGQQRLMSLYYFRKQRFPRKEKRVELRSIFDEAGGIPEDILHDDKYFSNFRLSLPVDIPTKKNRFHQLNYSMLGEYQTQFDLRPIRNVIIKQNVPQNDKSSMYEIFNRLNTGGTNLRPQEIRASLYHSSFYVTLYRINSKPEWRRLIRSPEPDLYRKDVEVLLRGFAFLMTLESYPGSISRFLNQFSNRAQAFDKDLNKYLENLFESFLHACETLPQEAFLSTRTNRFNLALYEAVFTAACDAAYREKRTLEGDLDYEKLITLANDEEFLEASTKATARTSSVKTRLRRASAIIGSL
jgi:uncharacterized protein with ParB-like and HNH nuclease domain